MIVEVGSEQDNGEHLRGPWQKGERNGRAPEARRTRALRVRNATLAEGGQAEGGGSGIRSTKAADLTSPIKGILFPTPSQGESCKAREKNRK